MPELDNAAMNNVQPITTVEEQGWKQRVNAEIPSHHQARLTDIPQLVRLYDAYRTSYDGINVSNATCMQHAKAFAFALLIHYYPVSEGFIVAPCSPGPVASNGMSFLLATGDKSDVWGFKPPQKARKNRRLSKKQEEINDAAEYGHCINYLAKSQWHRVDAEDIAAFVVQRDDVEYGDASAALERKTHTQLIIMIDQFDSVAQFSDVNILQRCDILADLLCSQGKIQNGYGILFHGPLIEVYDFDRGAEFIPYADDNEEAQDIEPKIVLSVSASGVGELVLDTRVAGLNELDGVFRQAAALQVTHVPHGIAGARMGPAVGHGIDHGYGAAVGAGVGAVASSSKHGAVDPSATLSLPGDSGSDMDAEGSDDSSF